MNSRQIMSLSLVCLIATSSLLPAIAYPGVPGIQGEQAQRGFQGQEGRKFAEKPNSVKKIAALEDRNDLDDLNTNQIPDGGFSWSNMIAMVMQMLFNPIGSHNGPNKSDGLDTDTGVAPASPWTNLLTVGLRILSAFLGGGGVGGDGIDKVDNSSPMQGVLAAVLSAFLGSRDPDQVATMAKQAGEFINIVVNLLDALKTSFSHRSIAARSIGKKDTVSEAAVAGITLFKGYVKTMKTDDESCMLKYMCEANRDCSDSTNGSSSIYCQLGTYVASLMMQRSGATRFDSYYEAGRRGRSGDDCQQLYLSCNEV
ncbi:uncharacterized protein LOC106670216 isoform X1 [Cimex lectularius]|uniref:Secreted protein n=1 Tax=Cimex lectularius TaxID=79782 RepID=A0A8I6S471_CIMLE|nr:uncharacterized protein LOC106670216 isoform X1 [Cimex lectularius]